MEFSLEVVFSIREFFKFTWKSKTQGVKEKQSEFVKYAHIHALFDLQIHHFVENMFSWQFLLFYQKISYIWVRKRLLLLNWFRSSEKRQQKNSTPIEVERLRKANQTKKYIMQGKVEVSICLEFEVIWNKPLAIYKYIPNSFPAKFQKIERKNSFAGCFLDNRKIYFLTFKALIEAHPLMC